MHQLTRGFIWSTRCLWWLNSVFDIDSARLTLNRHLTYNSSVSINLGTSSDSHRNGSASSISNQTANLMTPRKFICCLYFQYHVKYPKSRKIKLIKAKELKGPDPHMPTSQNNYWNSTQRIQKHRLAPFNFQKNTRNSDNIDYLLCTIIRFHI
jgi:hypothetical protein